MNPLHYQKDKRLSEFSTLGIGGPARIFVEVTTVEELSSVVKEACQKNIPFIVIGKGSNCLFDDRGFDGLVVLNRINFIEQHENQIYVGSGYSFSLLGVQTARNSFSGLEFASGIPATVGGAIYMNAGAGGPEVADVLTEVEYISWSGQKVVFKKEECSFSYRTSIFQNMKGAIAAARFSLIPKLKARQLQLEIISYRTKTQPYGEKSAGCVFRNPEGQSAGALIEKCGLKGMRVGGAEVSFLHANFLINKENATARDFLELIYLVQKTVKTKTGIELETEVRVIPYIPS